MYIKLIYINIQIYINIYYIYLYIISFFLYIIIFNYIYILYIVIYINIYTLPNELTFETAERISSFDISKGKITKIIRSLGPNKAHEHDGISIRMLKL